VGDDELAARAQAGQTLAELALLERYRRLARAKRHDHFLVGGDGEDVEQEALIGLANAVHAYRPGHGTSFRTFAEVCITRQLASAIRTASRQKHQALNRYVSLSGPPDGDGAGPAAVDAGLRRHHVPDPLDHVVAREGTVALRSAMSGVLSDLESDVLHLHAEGWSYQEIAEHLGRHVKAIDNGLQRARRKAGLHLTAGGGGERRTPLAS
jgi:RNA polymerase sporulation-specific sigma factor